MPELPEVEVTRLSFADRIEGAVICGVRLGKPLRWPLGCEPEALIGRTVLQVRRRGKYLLIDLDFGLLLVHLGMSGSVLFECVVPAASVHDHFDLITTLGTLRLHDPRRFGAVVFSNHETAQPALKLLGKLGVEPIGDLFIASKFAQALKRHKTSIKQVLLAGQVVVGVGNIYASEALFLSGIRPTALSNRIGRERVFRLHAAIQDVLIRAVSKGGSTLKDFSNARGQSGYFQLEVNVYGRAGEPCRSCNTPIQSIRQGQRSSFFCSVCQKS